MCQQRQGRRRKKKKKNQLFQKYTEEGNAFNSDTESKYNYFLLFVYRKTPQGTFEVMKSTNVYLESHVLQEETCSVVLFTLIATASTDPESNLW